MNVNTKTEATPGHWISWTFHWKNINPGITSKRTGYLIRSIIGERLQNTRGMNCKNYPKQGDLVAK